MRICRRRSVTCAEKSRDSGAHIATRAMHECPMLLDGADVAGRIPEAMRGEPIESVRCRLCRRGSVELVLGVARDAMSRDRVAVELRARCGACRRQSKVAWSDARPTDQEVRLDLLYGRR